jgi:hypothetical protein
LEFALVNVPSDQIDIVKKYIEDTIESFSHASTSVWVEGQKHVIEVTGGVQSGIRFTSLLGNFWNMVMSSIVRELVTMDVDDVQEVYVRGDDSAIICDSYASCLLFRLGYMAINAVGHDAKYGIHYQNSEFLRVWYTPDQLYGYPNRTIPSLIQRKPWTAEPWDAEAATRNLLDTCGIIERRTQKKQLSLRKIVVRAWTNARHQSAKYLELPRALGGLGLLPWNGWVPDKVYPKIDSLKAKFKVPTGTSDRYKIRYEKYVTLSEQQATELQQMDMNGKASGDDIRGYNRMMRQKFVSKLSRLGKVDWQQTYTPIIDELSALTPVVLGNMKSAKDMEVYTSNPPGMFGKYRSSEQTWMDLTVLASVTKIKPMDEFRKREPLCHQELKVLEKRGWHRGTAFDYLFGKIAGIYIGSLHPILTKLVTVEVAGVLNTLSARRHSRGDVNWIMSKTAEAAVSMIQKSKLNTKLFLW